ncbi:MAG: FixJ family two-component response regulator [Bacteroidia bacterium]
MKLSYPSIQNLKTVSDKLNHILYVDDEDPNLIAFRAIFRREFTVFTASSADDARQILDKDHAIKVIISDNIMKGVTGVEFFESILTEHPDPIRIILTGFADHSTMINAINQARVFRFLSKPWNEYDLRQTILSAIELYDTRLGLRNKQAKLNESYKTLNKYINTSSNEMRSILVSVQGLTHLALSEECPAKDSIYLPLIEKGVLQLDLQLRTIIESYNEEREVKSNSYLDFAGLVNTTLASMKDFHPIDVLKITHRYQKNLGFVHNPYKIKLLLNNLFTFSISNRKEGQEHIEVDLELISNDEGIKLMVTDNGRGLDETNKAIFDSATNSLNRAKLGIYMIKDAVKSLGGSIEIDGVLNEGTAFSIDIPYNQP